MSIDTSVPGYPELSDWPTAPAPPVHISNSGRLRDSGPQGGTYYVDLVDSRGTLYPFFFDRFLGRLCYGSYESQSDAAFLRRGSRIEEEAVSLIEGLAANNVQDPELLKRIRHAKTWVPYA
ncbi:hypothetical protein [Stenotrophomonas bentonitica]|uniref:hypothetical protein n=1 Tax=Stenotrophomonas bentonitica TaxID=1450134 RepID=UPI00345E53DF